MFCFGNICCSHLSDLPSTVPPSSCGDGHHCSCWPVSLQLLSLTQYKRFRWFHITPLTRLFQNTRNLATYVYVRRIFSSSTQVAESPNCAFIIVNSGVFFLLLHWNTRLKSLKYIYFFLQHHIPDIQHTAQSCRELVVVVVVSNNQSNKGKTFESLCSFYSNGIN